MAFVVLVGILAGFAAVMAALVISEEVQFRKKRDAAVKAGKR
jgi:hypothetical protein